MTRFSHHDGYRPPPLIPYAARPAIKTIAAVAIVVLALASIVWRVISILG